MSTAAPAGRLASRSTTARRAAGYGAAMAMALYLVVKSVWVMVSLTTGDVPDSWDRIDWVALNVVTIGLASAGVALGLALAQDWGRRVPAAVVVGLGWIGSGFLVTLLPYLVVSGALHAVGLINPEGTTADHDALPAWETAMLGAAFAGMALGLAIALPIYVRERWPGFIGRAVADPSAGRSVATWFAAAGASVLGIIWTGWAIGADVGLRSDAPPLDAEGRMLLVSWGAWALVASATLVVLGGAAGRRTRVRAPRVLAFFASGSLFAWSAWKLPITLWAPPDHETPELPLVAVGQHVLGIGVGLLALYVLLGRAKPHEPQP